MMNGTIQIPDYVVIVFMLVLSASIGLYFRFSGGRQRTTEEFLMAGRNMGVLPVSFSLMATYISAITILGVPAEVYRYGTQYIILIVGLPIGGLISAYLFLPVFFDAEVCTAYGYLEKRFGKTTRTIASVLFVFQMILYMAVVLYAPSLALNAVTGLSTWTSVFTIAIVCTFYSSLGGMKAVLWTDVLQSLLMYTTVLSILVKGFIDLGSFEQFLTVANEGRRLVFFNMSFDMTMRYTFWNCFLSGILLALNTFGTSQVQIQRLMSVSSYRKAKWALLFSVPMMMMLNIISIIGGVVIYARSKDCDPMRDPSNVKVTSPDQLVTYTILTLFGGIPGMVGLCISGVFSASLSTMSSAMNSLTAVTMEDFIRPYFHCKALTESCAALLAKIVAISYGCLCLLLTFAVSRFQGVLEACNIVLGMVGGPVLGIFSLGMFTVTANEKGTLVGLFVGFSINAWLAFGSYFAQVRTPQLPTSIEGCMQQNETEFKVTTPAWFNETNAQKMEDNSSDVMLLYRLSYLWFPLISSILVFIVGYAASVVIGRKCSDKPIDKILISPLFRKWLCQRNSKHLRMPEKCEATKEQLLSEGLQECNICRRMVEVKQENAESKLMPKIDIGYCHCDDFKSKISKM